MNKINIQEILASMEKKPLNKEVFCTTENLKAQVTFLQAGNSIPPCKMDNDVLFYVLSGKGTITVDAETNEINAGYSIVVPHQAESRSMHAQTDMEILAVRGLK